MFEKVPLFPRNANQENVKRYEGIKNGINRMNLKKFLYDKFEHSSRRASINPTTPESVEAETPINNVLKKIKMTLESNEKSMKFQSE